ncbi:MAG: hypothetical protein AAGB93_20885 [Planctomycetota bacterium]
MTASTQESAPSVPRPAPAPTASTDAAALRAPRPSQIRSGVLAACCAIAVIVGVTAIPTGAGGGPAAGFAPISTLGLHPLPQEGVLPVLDLGEELGAFELPGLPAWRDYLDDSAILTVWFKSTTLADAAFAGEIRFRKPVAAGSGDLVRFVDSSLGDDASSWVFEGARGYARIEGELYGRGAYDGVVLRLESAEGSPSARRGLWRGSEGAAVPDAVFARFAWRAEGDPVRAAPIAERGTATLAGRRDPGGRGD